MAVIPLLTWVKPSPPKKEEPDEALIHLLGVITATNLVVLDKMLKILDPREKWWRQAHAGADLSDKILRAVGEVRKALPRAQVIHDA
jgi:hypothetical protein